MNMLFGKYRGQPLEALPNDYLQWLLGLSTLVDPLLSALVAEQERRATQEPPPKPPKEQIRQAALEIVSNGYRSLARKYHPDTGGEHDSMVAINTANEWLKQHIERAV